MNKPIKKSQTETWELPDDQFPIKTAYFEFHEDYTSVKIFGVADEEDKEDVLYYYIFPSLRFSEAPKWVLDILIMCGVIKKNVW